MRVVYDVNVLARIGFGSNAIADAVRIANDGGAVLLICEHLISELRRTFLKSRLSGRIDAARVSELLSFLIRVGDPISIMPPFPTCRDPKDSYLLAMARDGKADFLVTNDLDLLTMTRIGDCEIVTPPEFGRRLEIRPSAG